MSLNTCASDSRAVTKTSRVQEILHHLLRLISLCRMLLPGFMTWPVCRSVREIAQRAQCCTRSYHLSEGKLCILLTGPSHDPRKVKTGRILMFFSVEQKPFFFLSIHKKNENETFPRHPRDESSIRMTNSSCRRTKSNCPRRD